LTTVENSREEEIKTALEEIFQNRGTFVFEILSLQLGL